MTSAEKEAEALDQFIEGALRSRLVAAAEGPPVDAATALVVNTLHAAALATVPDKEFVRELEARLLHRGHDATLIAPRPDRGWRHRLEVASTARGWSGSWWQRAAALTVIVVALGTSLFISLPVRAQLQRAACLIPRLGIRACDAPGLIAPNPVSVSRAGAKLTVAALLSSSGKTIMRLDIMGLAAPVGQLPAGPLRTTLNDTSGKEYPPADGWAKWVKPEDPQSISAVAVFTALDPSVRAVDLHVEEPQPVGSWAVRVPVSPVEATKLPRAYEGPQGATVEGITVRIASIAIDSEGTTVQVSARSAVAGRGIVNLANHQPVLYPLVLRDDKGREYRERARPQEALPRLEGPFTEDISFPPLATDARSVSLVLPFVTVVEETAPAIIRVPIAGKAAGDHIPLQADLRLGAYSFRVAGADLVEQPPGAPASLVRQQRGSWLALQLDYGDWNGGRKLVGPGVVENAHAIQSSLTSRDGVSQFTRVSVPLSEASDGEAVVTFQNARIAIRGPWKLEASVPGGR